VIAESLRLRPVVGLAGRRLATELRVGDFTLPPGSDLTPAIWLTHTRADLYPEPYAFRPERFLGHAPETYAWIPFGGGVRRCLGAAFAELEMRVVIETVLRARTLRPAAGPEHVVRRNVTFSPRHGTRVHATARRGSPRRGEERSHAAAAASATPYGSARARITGAPDGDGSARPDFDLRRSEHDGEPAGGRSARSAHDGEPAGGRSAGPREP
jgi:hypothetical protein